jgi:hypothetical protein
MPRSYAATRKHIKSKRAGFRAGTRKINYASKSNSGYLALTDKTTLGFPDVVRTKMRYYDPAITINPTVGNTAVHVFRLNSLFDFDYTGTGHQPRGFNQYEVSASALRATAGCRLAPLVAV